MEGKSAEYNAVPKMQLLSSILQIATLSVNFESKLSGHEFFQKTFNEFIFTSIRHVFFRFLEEIEDSKKVFRNYLTFSEKCQLNKLH